MKYINKYETTESFESEKLELKKLEHYLAYNAENDKVYLKSPSYLIYIGNRGPMRLIGGPLLITNRCDLIKTLKIDGVEQDLSGKIRTPHVFTATTENDMFYEIKNLINEKEEEYQFILNDVEVDKQYKVEIEWFDNITECINAFDTCEGLNSIPIDLFSNCTNVTSFSYTFGNCQILKSIPNNLFDACSKVTSFYGTFLGSGLETVPEKIFDNCKQSTSFARTFLGCESLTTIPEKLFSENKKVTNFNSTFSECNALTVMPKDNGTPIYNRSGEGKEGYELVTDCGDCFCNCYNIEGYELIPDEWNCLDS